MSVIKTQQTDSCVMSFISLETSKMSHLHLQTVSQNNAPGAQRSRRLLDQFYWNGPYRLHFSYSCLFCYCKSVFSNQPLRAFKKRNKEFGFFPHCGGGRGGPNPHFYKSGGMEKIHIFYLF